MSHTVLLVDDDERVLHGMSRALWEQPYQIYTARSGEEAMAILKAHSVDVVVTDEKMPGMSGSDLLSWMAGKYPDVIRIMLTGHANTETAIRAINDGKVYQFFTKPCDEVRLAITIRKALEHKDLQSEVSRLSRLSAEQVRRLECFDHNLELIWHILSEDIQTPLQSVERSCREFSEQCGDSVDPQVRKLLDTAMDASTELRRLVDDMIEHSRAENPSPVLPAGCTA